MSNIACQSGDGSLNQRFRQATVMSVFRKQTPRGATRRRPADRAATRRRRPGTAGHDVNTPTRLPDQLVSPFF